MVISSTVEGFVPTDIPLYVTPVQITGHVVNNLTTARSPQGRALFGWSSGGIFYCAVRDDFEDMFRDDIVPDGDERVVYDLVVEGRTVSMGSIWVDRGALYCAIKSSQGNSGYSVCYQADSPENPVVWTQRGIIDSFTGNAMVQTLTSCGPVTILPSGRWVLPFPVWGSYGSGACADFSGISYSDDRGIDWVVTVRHREMPVLSGTTGPISDTVGQDPLTGYLYWSHYWGALNNEGFVKESQDNGVTWVTIIADASEAWNFCIDDGVGNLYIAGATAGGEWEWWQAVDPTDDSTWIDLNLTVIASRQGNWQFQAIAFQSEGAIAYIDVDRIAVQRFASPGCPDPDLLHIPYKDRLLHLTISPPPDSRPAPDSFTLMADHDFDNMKEIERWAQRWITRLGADSSDGCRLHIPYKDHLYFARDGILTRAAQRVIAGQSFQNYKIIEWWAARIVNGECSCAAPDKCRLQIPFKDTIAQIVVDEDGSVDRASLTRAASQDFENYKAIERWANSYARGECSGSSQPWPPDFPPAPRSPARFSGEMVEVSLKDNAATRFAGEMMEVSFSDNAVTRFSGEMIEVSLNGIASAARLAGEMVEVAIVVP